MSYEIRILNSARRDIERIADMHLALVGPMSAKRFTDGILDTIETVAVSPDGYPHVPDAELSRQGYRMTLYKKYVCVYRVIDETVFVYHVADGRSDYGQLIRKLL